MIVPEYINHNQYAVHLPGPDGVVIKLKASEKRSLSDFFERYCTRGFIKRVGDSIENRAINKNNHVLDLPKRNITSKISKINNHIIPGSGSKPILTQRNIVTHKVPSPKPKQQDASVRLHEYVSKPKPKINQNIVGRTVKTNTVQISDNGINWQSYSISNNIGVGILSFNRLNSLRRLIDSIVKYTDLQHTTVFISDDGSTDHDLLNYLDELATNPNIVVIRNKDNLGIAGNSNRLLRCLERFKHCLLLNDDVEVLRYGWDQFYATIMQSADLHHMMYRQIGVYGAKAGDVGEIRGIPIKITTEKPHGAVLAFTDTMLQTVGYFDTTYGKYGMEHIDWSSRAFELKLQRSGFLDAMGSESFFKIHNDQSTVTDKLATLNAAKEIFGRRVARRHEVDHNSKLPEITYVIPAKNRNCTDAMVTVINNIRSQKFPVIKIIISEQDNESYLNLAKFKPSEYYLSTYRNNLFNKSLGFNRGVAKVQTEHVVLHDADMLIQNNYTQYVYNILQTYDSCHVGNTVVYATKDSSDKITSTARIENGLSCERVVSYYEGGSLACSVKAYWDVGGFNEDFQGYGCEDCDFYARLSLGSNYKNDRVFSLLHLWHSRADGWNEHHESNKSIELKLKSIDIKDRISLQLEQLKSLGYRL